MSFGINKNVNYTRPKPKSKPTSLLDGDNHADNRAIAERDNSSADDTNDAGGGNVSGILFREGKNKIVGSGASELGLPIVFLLSTVVGTLLSKKLFS